MLASVLALRSGFDLESGQYAGHEPARELL